ncbi:unnamed protein product [Arabis nemorensis]|uniref:Uncharacterized protein n=1 Tax=Arabis nemorensis TaxID=586526 RepID=A0A565AY31_9BRAS|nr:unnamed protein product [Arabis nemorensis]
MLTKSKSAYPDSKKKSWYEITLEEEEEEAAHNFNQPEVRATQFMAEMERLAVIDENDNKTMEPDATQLGKGKATVVSEESGDDEWNLDDDEWKMCEDFYTEEDMMNDDQLTEEANDLLSKDPIYME